MDPAGAVTWTEIVQVPSEVGLPAGIVPPVKLTLFAVVEVVPPQVFPVTPTTVKGAGRLSVKSTPVYAKLIGFCRVMVSVVVPPAGNVDGENRFVTPISRTVRRAVACVAFVRFCALPSAPAGILFVCVPCVSDVTLTVIMQEELGAMLPLLNVTDVPPATAVTEAEGPHPEVEAFGGFARKTFAGRLSVMAAWVSVVLAALLLILIVSSLVAPAQIVDGLKLLLTVGG